MLQSKKNIKKKLNQTTNIEEKTHPLVEQSHKKDCNTTPLLEEKYNRHTENARKLDFAARVYRDFGFICEV